MNNTVLQHSQCVKCDSVSPTPLQAGTVDEYTLACAFAPFGPITHVQVGNGVAGHLLGFWLLCLLREQAVQGGELLAAGL